MCAVLTANQRATWEQMAGLGPGPAVADAASQEESTADAAAATQGEATESATAEPMAGDAPEGTTPPSETDGGQQPATDQEAVQPPAADTESTEPAMDREAVQSPSDVQPAEDREQPEQPIDPENVTLRFNFRFQPWGDVLDWLAERADLSLQSGIVPEGTLNYSDTHAYTPDEAIDLINGILLHQGYTLVRRGRLLSVMNLEDDIPAELVEFVPLEKLDERGEYELIKTVFQLARMEPADVEQEIGQLLGPGRTMVVMPKARQILVTAPGGILRMVRDVIQRAENPTGRTDGVVEIVLKNITPEDLLSAARPLLGLQEGTNVGEEIAIAMDYSGTRMFVNGSNVKVEILENLAERLDVARAGVADDVVREQVQLLTHPIRTADPNEVLAVLQTLLAGLPDVRMSLDAKTTKIVALAPPSVHKTIDATIMQMEGSGPPA